jgi:hypothetical protein
LAVDNKALQATQCARRVVGAGALSGAGEIPPTPFGIGLSRGCGMKNPVRFTAEKLLRYVSVLILGFIGSDRKSGIGFDLDE